MRFVCYVNLGKVRNSGDMVVLLVNTSVYNIINVLGDYALRVTVLKKKLLDSLKLFTKPVVGTAKIFNW